MPNSGHDLQPSDDDSVGGLVARLIGAAIAAIATGGGIVAVSVFEARIAIAGVGVILITATLRLGFASSAPGQPERRQSRRLRDFHAWRDVDVAGRNDADLYRAYRQARAEAFTQWRKGELRHEAEHKAAKDRVLDIIINFEARRIIHACNGPVTLALIQDKFVQGMGQVFEAKRADSSSLGRRIHRGMKCLHTMALEYVLDQYATFHRCAEIHICDETYYLVALSNEIDINLSDTAIALLEGAANEYESAYQMFRWMAVSTPPALRSGEAE